MSSVLFILVPLLMFGGVIALAIVWDKKREQERTAGLEELAAEMSLQFSPAGDKQVESALSHLAVMQRGHSRRLHNLIRGDTQSVDLKLFDYRYTTGGGKNKTTHNLSVAAFDSPLLSLPPFELGPENFLHRLAGAFGYQDIDFAGYPTFNKRYLLRGPDEAAIRELFTESVVQHFENQLGVRKSISEVIGHGSLLLVATSRLKPQQLREFLEHAFSTYAVLKSSSIDQPDPP